MALKRLKKSHEFFPCFHKHVYRKWNKQKSKNKFLSLRVFFVRACGVCFKLLCSILETRKSEIKTQEEKNSR